MNEDLRRASPSVPDGYELREGPPSIAAFRRIRESAGMTDRPPAALERGLPNTTYGVHVVYHGTDTGVAEDVASDDGVADDVDDSGMTDDADEDERTVAMARIVGDGGTAFLIVDVAVEEAHQGKGLGTATVDALMDWLCEHAPPGGFVYLLADVDGFYERWGFEHSAPASKGMWIRTGEL